jgi:hypothetical protein
MIAEEDARSINLSMHATHIGSGFESGTNSGLDQLEEGVAGLKAG